MSKNLDAEVFGDFSQHDQTAEKLYELVLGLCQFPQDREN